MRYLVERRRASCRVTYSYFQVSSDSVIFHAAQKRTQRLMYRRRRKSCAECSARHYGDLRSLHIRTRTK